MMQGITTLPGAQQGNQQAPQAPGQAAQFQAMPAKQGGIAPPITAPLEKLPPQQLLSMYNNPQDTTPKWAVATAYAKAVEQARLMQMAQGQSAMAQGQAQAQQPPVVQQVMSQPIPETQYAAHGGIMHGYAGGGAVAFSDGKLTLERLPGETDKEYESRKEVLSRGNLGGASAIPYYLPPPSAERDRLNRLPFDLFNSGIEALGRGWEKFTEGSTIESQRKQRAEKERLAQLANLVSGYRDPNRARLDVPPAVPEAQKDTRQIPASEVRESAPAGPAGPAGPVRPSGPFGPATSAAPTGLNALIARMMGDVDKPNPELARMGRQAETNAAETAALLQRMQGVSPEEAAARTQFAETMQNAYAPQRARLEQALAEKDAGLWRSGEAFGNMARAAGGAKRFGQGLAAAAGAGADFAGEQRKRVERLSENYDTLSAQLNITIAQAKLADAQNDEKRKRELMLQAQGLKDKLLGTQVELLKTGTDIRKGDISGLASLLGASAAQDQAQAAKISAGKPTDFQQKLALYRADPNTYESMFGSKDAQLMTRVQQVTNTDPLLKQLASNAAMNLPGATEQYNARYRELIAMHAPELLIGTAPAAGGGARAAATDVVRKGQQ